MKQAAALFLFALFFFNLVGYRLVFEYMQSKASAQMEMRLDNEAYNESQLIELKVPINMPYQSNWPSYQRYSGKIQIDGQVYQYVKRKVANDTLYLLCIHDAGSQKIQTAKNEFFKITNDFPQNEKSDQARNISYKNHQSDYDDYSLKLTFGITLEQELSRIRVVLENLPSFPKLSPEQPPDFLTA